MTIKTTRCFNFIRQINKNNYYKHNITIYFTICFLCILWSRCSILMSFHKYCNSSITNVISTNTKTIVDYKYHVKRVNVKVCFVGTPLPNPWYQSIIIIKKQKI